MRTGRLIWIASLGSFHLAVTAMAADMTGEEAKKLISGNTVYLETTASSVTGTPGKGAIYYAADGRGLYKTPSGAIWHGNWLVKDNLVCTNWKEGPKRPCYKLDKKGDTISLIDSETGQVRAEVLKTAPGNAENLQP